MGYLCNNMIKSGYFHIFIIKKASKYLQIFPNGIYYIESCSLTV